MAKTITTVNESAERTGTYHFICIKCGKDSSPIPFTIHRAASKQLHGNTNGINDLQWMTLRTQLKNEAEENLAPILELVKSRFDNGNYIDLPTNVCPYCKTVQPWGNQSEKVNPVLSNTMGFFLLGGLVSGILANIDNPGLWVFIPAIAGLVLGLILGIVKRKKQKARLAAIYNETASLDKRQRPVITLGW